jgi:hypothetical protein
MIRAVNSLAERAIALVFATAIPLCAADTVTLLNGERKSGRILGVEQDTLVLSVQPVPGLPPVELRFSKSRLGRIEFGEDPQRDNLIRDAGAVQLPELEQLWQRFEPLLSAGGSPSARIGLRYGRVLLETAGADRCAEPLALFEKIARGAPAQGEREAARQGVLRCLLKGGFWERAEIEAGSICNSACGIPLLAEAKLTSGLVHLARLRALVGDNPRWNRDEFVRAERNRLHAAALDNLLGAALLPGVPVELSARALAEAFHVYQLAGDSTGARAVAGDLASLHPGSTEARLVTQQIEAHTQTLPAEPQTKKRP